MLGVNQVFKFSPILNGILILFCNRKFYDRLKRLFVIQIPRVTVCPEHIHLTAFRGIVPKSK